MADVLLETIRLSCVLGDSPGLSVQLQAGTCWGLLGAPGSGKTRWLRTLTHLQAPAEGKLVWRGVDITRRPGWRMGALRRWAAMIIANPAQVAEPWAPLRRLLPRDPVLARAFLVRAGLPPVVWARRVEDLSLAQRVRLTMARALAGGTRVLLVDNVAARLWPEVWTDLLADMRRAMAQEGALMVAAHRSSALTGLAYWIVLAEGVPVEWGRAEALLERPRHPVTQALIQGREPQRLSSPPADWEQVADIHWWRPTVG